MIKAFEPDVSRLEEQTLYDRLAHVERHASQKSLLIEGCGVFSRSSLYLCNFLKLYNAISIHTG